MPRVQGEVIQVSGDRLTDEKTGNPTTAQIYVDMAEVQKKTPEVRLSAGMPAGTMIITGERTMFEYLDPADPRQLPARCRGLSAAALRRMRPPHADTRAGRHGAVLSAWACATAEPGKGGTGCS